MNYLLSKTMRVAATFAALAVTTAAVPAFAVTSPDFPMAGFATQNGGTTGGKGYSEVTVDNVNDLKSYAKAGNKIIYVKPGTYMGPVEVGSNVTIYGYQGAIIAQPASGSAMKLSGSKNVIIRNLKFKGVGAHDDDDEDCLQVNHESKNVWIDHVDVYDGHDGNLDITNASDYVTISWTKFSYTSASTGHQFSNLIGNSKTKTSDRGHLNVTIHHTWWADGVVERMPRVRFGKVHVANNLFDSKNASYCVRAAVEADIRIERNVFIGVQKALDLYTSDGTITAAQMIENYEENVKKPQAGTGTAFKPSYSMSLTDVSTQAKAYALRDSIKLYAGATLPDPGKSQTVTPASSSSEVQSSSSVAVSSSSVAKSSSSVAQSSSSQAVSSSSQGEAVSGTATLTKHGSGSAKQEVKQGESIEEFYFTVAGATGATVTGLPEGVSGTMKGSDFYISGTVAQNAAVGAYNFTVTTTGATTNATKNGTITVVGANGAVAESSSSSVESSSSKVDSSSSSEQGTTSLDVATVASHFNVSVNGRVLTVQGATQTAYLLDAQGRLITKVQSLGRESLITVPRAGMYLLRVGNEARRITVR
ncbi:putative pectate lyase [Fibrobacter succinogenes subsp. succinogenes S85]|uniref:Pectate lyase/Amb allergen n=1 Tax=Fibrobacter succinogenes (strain ATCC 19169 / S85) TaxID=59374 RepID=C9RJS5_FIBSS|nr:pectate lyase [Fibrobacter succinogenes]ACX73788.1 Pectate lyase/Amb allergen [Fibrobacter succinogenes subsp. succinogenes S85]ADL26594.1 putative pectate lyase [Fibrobacter succinogenes subsp. succinogenes S85]